MDEYIYTDSHFVTPLLEGDEWSDACPGLRDDNSWAADAEDSTAGV
jgi:hypothetical protein